MEHAELPDREDPGPVLKLCVLQATTGEPGQGETVPSLGGRRARRLFGKLGQLGELPRTDERFG